MVGVPGEYIETVAMAAAARGVTGASGDRGTFFVNLRLYSRRSFAMRCSRIERDDVVGVVGDVVVEAGGG